MQNQKITIVRPALLVSTLVDALERATESAPVLVGIVDPALDGAPGIYSLVDDDQWQDSVEPGKFLQLSGTRPGVPRPLDKVPDLSPIGRQSRSLVEERQRVVRQREIERIAHNRIHPGSIKPFAVAAYDAWFAESREGSTTASGMLAELRKMIGGAKKQPKKAAKRPKPDAGDEMLRTEVLVAIFDEEFADGEIVENASRIRFNSDAVAVEFEWPGFSQWVEEKTYGRRQ